MTVRAVPCPFCKRVPKTTEMDSGGFRTYCMTYGCRMSLDCFGRTEDSSRICWNDCIDREDYR